MNPASTFDALFTHSPIAGRCAWLPQVMKRVAERALAMTVSQDARASAEETSPRSRAEFDRLVVVHLDAAYNLARFLSRDADAAQDIVQEAILRAFKAYPGLRGTDVRVWLLAIVRNCFRDWAAMRRRLERYEVSADLHPDEDDGRGLLLQDVAADQESVEDALIRRSDAETVRRILLGLPEVLREVLVLREFEQLSYREIAEVAHLPIGTVMSRLARARAAFAKEWLSQDRQDLVP